MCSMRGDQAGELTTERMTDEINRLARELRSGGADQSRNILLDDFAITESRPAARERMACALTAQVGQDSNASRRGSKRFGKERIKARRYPHRGQAHEHRRLRAC